MKHFIIAVMLTCMVTPALGADANGNYRVIGEGVNSCGEWTSQRAGKTEFAATWVLGFVSAYNRYVPDVSSIAKGTDAQGIWAWVDNYCAANPINDIDDAAGALVTFLKNR